MHKDFDRWNNRKKKLHEAKDRPFFHVREVWFCHLGVNIGFEQDGTSEEKLRPVLILKKFNNEVCWILPFTKTEKTGTYYFPAQFVGDADSRVILSQIRLIDSKRLKYLAGYIDAAVFTEIQKRLKDFLS
jgi:mRNA interferase MazF